MAESRKNHLTQASKTGKQSLRSGKQRSMPSARTVEPAPTAHLRLKLSNLGIRIFAVAPLAFLPGIYDRWGWPVIFLHLLGACLVVLSAPKLNLPGWLAPGMIGLVGVWTILALTGPNPILHLFGRSPRFEGILTWIALAATLWAGATLFAGHRARQAMTTYATTASWAMLPFGAISLLESLGYQPIPTDVARPGSLAGNATDQGLLAITYLAAITAAIALNWEHQHTRQPLLFIGISGALISLLTSASRGAYLAAAVLAAAIMIVAMKIAGKQRRVLTISAVLIAAIVAVTLFLPDTQARFFAGDPLAGRTFDERFIMVNMSLHLLGNHMWLGIRPNSFADAIPAYFPRDWYVHTDSTTALDSPHNWIIHILLDGGIISALAVVACATWVARYLLRSYLVAGFDQRMVTLLLGGGIMAVCMGLLTTVNSPKVLLGASFILGALIGIQVAFNPSQNSAQDHQDERLANQMPRAALAIVCGLTAVLVLGAIVGDAYILRALAAAQQGNIDSANTSFVSASRVRPWDRELSLRAAEALGGALESHGRNSAQGREYESEIALNWAQEAVKNLPDSYRSHQALGMIYLNQENLDKAVESLERAVTLNPVNPQLRHSLGLALAFSGRNKEARKHLEFALDIVPDSEPTQELLARLRRH